MASENIAQRTFKFRVYPSKAQITHLQSTLSLCCELYNAGLQERRDARSAKRHGTSMSASPTVAATLLTKLAMRSFPCSESLPLKI